MSETGPGTGMSAPFNVLLVLLYSLPLLFVHNFVTTVQALGASCKCIAFQETYGKEYGVFTSPNWPLPYEDNIECLLYTFLAAADQLVEITFDEFDVQKTNLDCVYGDFVKLYLHLEDSVISEETSWNDVLCGKIADIEQTHYSSGSSLVFEFHSDWRNGNNTGFRGTYRFLSKRMFETDGQMVAKSKCDYKFESLSALSGNASLGALAMSRSTRGRFYSPQYPSTYPKGIQCSYTFVGQQIERVKLVFEHLRLQKSDLSCLNSPDVIYVHDGRDKNSPVIGQLCNTNAFVELVSTGSYLYIEFISRSHFPGQGFKGRFYFETIAPFNAPDVPSTEPEKTSNTKTTATAASARFPIECDQWITSDTSKNGSITTPNYPEPYPGNIHCTYHFASRGKERVQILFTDFSLYKPDDTSRDCEGADVVMVFITINGQKERVDNFCGDDLPQQLMSNGPSMSVEFKSQHTSDHAKGFRFAYKFVTNFGIASGSQDSQSVCGFVFNSLDRTNGSFTSPNWPGFYPRDTECHYFFYGNQSERVHITFAYFDVEGVTPCSTETASDYVEFSNYKTVDRKIPRHCGLKKPKTIESDGDFFRVSFKSNDRFDGTGFEAFYQFRSPEDTFSVKKMRGTSDAMSRAVGSSLMVSMTALIVILNRMYGNR